MADKKNWYDEVYKAVDLLPYTDEKAAAMYPELWKWHEAPVDHGTRAKMLKSLLSNRKFRDELADLDFIEGKFGELLEGEIDNGDAGSLLLGDVPMSEVEAWYSTAKKAIDPKGNLRDTELWDTAGDATFSKLERAEGKNDDWFSSLMDAFGYPDTAEGAAQLNEDLLTVLTRMKNASYAKKYGAVPKFLFGNTFERMGEGYKPTKGDVASDVISNAAWMTPFGSFIKPVEGATAGARAIAGLKANSIAPIINEAAKVALGSGNEGIGEVLSNVGTNTLVNTAAPLQKMLGLLSRGGSWLEKGLNQNPGELTNILVDGAKTFGESLPWLEAYIDNRLGNDVFAKRLKRMLVGRIKSMFGIGADSEEE